MNINEKISKRRKELGLSLQDVANELGVHRSTVMRYESSDIEKMPIDIVPSLAKVLKCTPEYLMGWEDIPNDSVANLVKLLENPVSAGRGTWLDDGYEYTFIEVENKPQNVDFALKVRGDSMEPMYSDDDIVFVKSNVVVEQGQIGIFVLNGEGYLKQWQGNRLVSLNPSYEPIYIGEYDEFLTIGRVVGKIANPMRSKE